MVVVLHCHVSFQGCTMVKLKMRPISFLVPKWAPKKDEFVRPKPLAIMFLDPFDYLGTSIR